MSEEADDVPYDGDDSLKVYVSRLPPSWTEDHLKDHFNACFGNADSVYIKKDNEGISSRFGFVTFSCPESRNAALAQESMHIKKRTIKIREVIRDEEAVGRGRDVGVCFAWKKFNCVKGSACKFLHEGLGSCISVPDKGCGKGKKCISFKTKGKCSKGDSCPFLHERKQESTKKRFAPDDSETKVCHSFVKKGKCRKGDSCPFAHTESTDAAAAAKPDPPSNKKRRINGAALVKIRTNQAIPPIV
jgi:RNA recognition motif-containing protein